MSAREDTNANECRDFKPHLLRPEKCRTCFVELARHPTPPRASEPSGQPNSSRTSSPQNTFESNNGEQQAPAATNDSKEAAKDECPRCRSHQEELDRLRRELDEWRSKCQLAEGEARRAREEMRTLESEMEEMHDNFREEESEQFEQVKQELDACLKNCKILQIRLNKSERQYGQLEQVKQLLERQLEERAADQAAGASSNPSSSSPVFGRQLSEGHQQSSSTTEQQQQQLNLQADGEDLVRVPAREYDQMLRDLNDTSERERDLQEQIKYSQEEAHLKGERLQAIEAENEILLGRINKLTQANSALRSSLIAGQAGGSPTDQEPKAPKEKARELCEQNEQLKLALELAQAEGQRLRGRVQELQQELEARSAALKATQARLEDLQPPVQLAEQAANGQASTTGAQGASLELECRRLRARLVQAERECRQLRSQVESMSSSQAGAAGRRATGSAGLLTATRSHSMEAPATATTPDQQQVCPSGRCAESVRSLDRQCRGLLERNQQLETKMQRLIELSSNQLDAQTNMETDLFEKLKRQVDASESELAKAKSRLVELDIECGRARRQYKRLLSSLETCGSAGGELALLRRNKLPASDALRDSLSRAELRQAVRDLELDIEDLIGLVKAKECLIREQAQAGKSLTAPAGGAPAGSQQDDSSPAAEQQVTGEQVKSLRRLLDQEQLLSNNLKLDVANLEQDNREFATRTQMLERERVAMDEELDKMRALLGEQRAELEESERERSQAQLKARELFESLEKVKVELAHARSQGPNSRTGSPQQQQQQAQQSATDLLLMARDLSELKVKNGFLMRQLEMAREDANRQMEELRQGHELQQRRAIELAQLELKERHLQEGAQVRDELQEAKARLVQLQRQCARQEEEMAHERDRARALERDWRRDKSQWQQVREQLEGQLAIEKRSSEFRLKEAEQAMRDKERALTSLQDRCVQLERDLKRLQNKYHLLEEDSESKWKQLSRDLELRTKDAQELARTKAECEERLYECTKRFQGEKMTLKETLETIKRSYDEKLVEARQLRELLQARQEQSYKDRTLQLERIEQLTRRLNEASELEGQCKLLKQRLEIQERQLESARRELAQVKEERTRLRARCDELEKRELITKTSSISGAQASHSFLKPFGSKSQFVGRVAPATSGQQAPAGAAPASTGSQSATASQEQLQQQQQQPLVERLSGKINDQRHLINILRQQLIETQTELKQLKLLQSSERFKWQTNVALLTSRLNECEEKLANETALLNRNSRQLMEQLVGPRLESSWSQERLGNLELLKQQQQQIEVLSRDLKKTSQAHDLLRLQSKQLEAHNNKLARKLIEYQQSSSIFHQADRQLESQLEELRERHARLERDTRPLVEIVTKIVSSLDAPEQQVVAIAQKSPQADSTERPLRAGSTLRSAAVRREQQQLGQRDSDDSESELSLCLGPPVGTMTAARPAYQQAQPPSRLTRLLAGGKSSDGALASTQRSPEGRPAPGSPRPATPGKTVKRVRVKCSTLGITTTEKKLLKQQLKSLAEALEAGQPRAESETSGGPVAATTTTTTTTSSRPLASTGQRASAEPQAPPPRQHSASTLQSAQSSSTTGHSHTSSRVHWQMDSDLESERSWSLEPAGHHLAATTGGRNSGPGDVYRRFPQATPSLAGGRAHSSSVGPMGGGGGSSLTDYESESSLASDYSLGFSATAGGRHLLAGGPSSGGGAESDSGLLASSKISSGRKKSTSGFKGRLTSTLRNISRSITGLGSDAEEAPGEGRRRTASPSSPAADEKKRSSLKEIRV